MIVDYAREYSDIIFRNLLNSNLNCDISIFYEKQDSYKVIKDLTNYIGNIGVELKDNADNRNDIDIAAFSYQDAKYIRKELQVNNENIYFLYIYVILYGKTEKELEFFVSKAEGILNSSGLYTRKTYFRQEQCFKACLPICENSTDLKCASRRNVLTSGIVSTYPFVSANIFDESGVFIGRNIYTNSLIFVDKFDKEKYKNANMCVFGESGAGKSFFIKLQILRNWMMGITQYIIDPEHEYYKIAESLNGTLIKIGPTSNSFINVLDIRQDSIEEGNGYLATKLNKLKGFFSLIYEDIDEENYGVLEKYLIKMYEKKGITFDDTSLFETGCFKSFEEMPTLEDLYNELPDDEIYLKSKLNIFVNGSLKYFNQKTNVNLENNLIVADIYELGEENLKYAMFIFIDLFWDKIKINRNENKIIYLDEIWRLIGVVSNKEVASFIYKIFKTIRKFGGSCVAITQDVSDLFSLDDGIYGKSILNNSNIKALFSLEEENILVLEKYTSLSEKEKIELKSLNRGECLMFVQDNHILVRVEASDLEKELI